jgi:hypothetical protein
MEPHRGVGTRASLRVAGVLLLALCLLGVLTPQLAHGGTMRAAGVHVAGVVNAGDGHAGQQRGDHPVALLAAAERVPPPSRSAGTASSSSILIERTARSARMRGPPVEAAR